MLDWELAHAGDPAEDIGWLCAPAWRFGGGGEVGGFGALAALLQAYRAAGGEDVTPDRVHWWQVYATVKWATICALQASTHLNGITRSVELAAIGRRVARASGTSSPSWARHRRLTPTPFWRTERCPLSGDRPRRSSSRRCANTSTASWSTAPTGRRFEARVARNALGIVERELRVGPSLAVGHAARLEGLGFTDDGALAAALRSGAFDDDWEPVARALAASAA